MTRTKQRIADIALRVMKAAGEDRVMFGDGILRDIAREAGIKCRSMYDEMQRVLDGIERAPDLFEKVRTYGYDSRGYTRLVRLFKIRTVEG